MNAPVKKYLFLLPTLLLLGLFFFLPSQVKAQQLVYNSISFSPTSGLISSNETPISVVLDSGNEDFAGIEVTISYTGDVQYVRSTKNNDVCGLSFSATPQDGSLNLLCMPSLTYSGPHQGNVATLYFRSTASGTSNFSFTSTDPDFSSEGTGQYTLSLETDTTATGTTTGVGGGDLPDAGIFDSFNITVIIGFYLIIIGIFFNKIVDFIEKKTVNYRRDSLEKNF